MIIKRQITRGAQCQPSVHWLVSKLRYQNRCLHKTSTNMANWILLTPYFLEILVLNAGVVECVVLQNLTSLPPPFEMGVCPHTLDYL